MRRAAKTDDNHESVVKALRSIGCTVHSLAAVGNGCPDLLVGFRKKTYLIEVKDGKKSPSERKLTPLQVEWHASWRGGHLSVAEWPDEAVDQILKDVVG